MVCIGYDFTVHVQNKQTLVLTLNLMDVRNTLIECERVLILHMHRCIAYHIARTIIEMIAREHAQEIYLSVEKLMHQFRLGKKYSVSD